MLEFFSTQSGHSHFSQPQGSAEQPPLQCASCPHFKQVYLIYLSCKNGTAILFPLPMFNYACYNKAVGYYICCYNYSSNYSYFICFFVIYRRFFSKRFAPQSPHLALACQTSIALNYRFHIKFFDNFSLDSLRNFIGFTDLFRSAIV